MANSDTSTEVEPVTFDHLKRNKKPNHKEVTILLDPDLGIAVDTIRAELLGVEKHKLLRTGENVKKPLTEAELKKVDKEIAEIKARLEDAEEQMYAASVKFKFKSIGRRAMDDLLTACPPTKKQIEEAKAEGNSDLSFNPEVFPQALIAASVVEPAMTPEQVEELWDDESWTTPELTALFMCAQEANQDFRILDPKKGSGRTQS